LASSIGRKEPFRKTMRDMETSKVVTRFNQA
jgi:hypothetical protein